MPDKVNLTPQSPILKGLQILHDTVTSSLGPKGMNTMINQGYDIVSIHDGVKIANSINLEDIEQDTAVRAMREASQRQVKQVGDGTTVVISLAYNILLEANKVIATGVHPMSLKRGLEKARDVLIKDIESRSIPVKTKVKAIEIATISAADKNLGKLIGEVMWDIGEEGIVTVEASRSFETEVERQEGMQFDKGYSSSYFITNPDRMEATVEDASLLISDMPITDIHELIAFLEGVGKTTRNLVIIAPEISGSALETFVLTKLKGGMNILAIPAPLFEQTQQAFLQDLAVLTGGKVVTKDAGMRFENLTMDYLGKARRVTSTKDATIIVGGQGKKQDIQERVASIRTQIEDSQSEFETLKLKERLAKLTTGISIIKVGGQTEIEIKESYERAEDAKEATRAAIRSGIVPGGETIYLRAREALGNSTEEKIMYRALEKPFCTLVENAGLNAGKLMGELEHLEGKIDHVGIDVMDEQPKDMMKAGIIDPTDVSVYAIQNAVSVAIALLTTKNMITPIKEEKK